MRAALALAMALAATSAQAQFMDGNRMHMEMTSGKSQSFMLGYVAGVYDVVKDLFVCPPPGVTAGQLFDMTKQWLEQNPAQRTMIGDRVVVAALAQVWPCPTKSKQ